jgi:hypothetical protein
MIENKWKILERNYERVVLNQLQFKLTNQKPMSWLLSSLFFSLFIIHNFEKKCRALSRRKSTYSVEHIK